MRPSPGPPHPRRRASQPRDRGPGAVLRRPGADWEIHELTVAPPRAGEVLVRMAYAGVCHSDEHMRFSTTTGLPVVGGHESSAVVQETGPG